MSTSDEATFLPPEQASTTRAVTPAGWWSRVGATILDGIIVLVPLVLAILLSDPSGVGGALAAMIYFTLVLFYAPVLLVMRDGQTLGKSATGIRVRTMDGEQPGFGRAVGREWLKLLFSITGILWVIDVLWPLWHPENRALHDLATGTRVDSDTPPPGPSGHVSASDWR